MISMSSVSFRVVDKQASTDLQGQGVLCSAADDEITVMWLPLVVFLAASDQVQEPLLL